ncbi:hypothetical protein DSO57_1023275 [Entomophthora muscae]|uniref:Uncharacterized protein n=1 Tax=Entomophthora muscae TaxID=34485 RepID=A0ACC2TQC5_9FUNG|nr:hypothetical protein DSO57_1023275 [Entomophthora muscae]
MKFTDLFSLASIISLGIVSSNQFIDKLDLFCAPGTGFISHMNLCMYIPVVCNTSFKDIQAAVQACKEKSGAKFFVSMKAQGSTYMVKNSSDPSSDSAGIHIKRALQVKEKFVSSDLSKRVFDGVNYEIFEIKSKEALEHYFQGWSSEAELALTMKASQWSYLGGFINKKSSFFFRILIWIQSPDELMSLEALDKSTSIIKPEQKIWVLIEDSMDLKKESLMKQYSWIGGIIDISLLTGKHYIFYG